ncbi:KICSTOR complex protein SZT2 [Amphibalanus amphitrite]|uniref:KICSTOR complex protein SZT2 n=1 Tax=Amphibalanus amphitrite TaxID=1232801 RepID=A0A6A4X459_AMPAM|nr:KICSTOR complex protein SZT2 [Amphibalanus amphitrite]
MVVRLAFLGGTPGHRRNQIVKDLRERILALTFTESQTALSADPPIRKHARLLEKPDQPKTVAIDDGTPERGVMVEHYGGSRAAAQEVRCCVLLKKPVEKFLIRYDRVPRNFLSPVIQQTQPAGRPRPRAPPHASAVSSQNRTASTMFNTLSRYLHHRRWVWDMQDAGGPSLSMAAMGRIIATVIKTRLQEGFSFAHTSNGVLNLVLELEMQHPHCRPAGGALAPQSHPFVVQYVLFPPHITAPPGSGDNLSVSEDEPGEAEMESIESDSMAEIVTECWIEPQSGHLVTQRERQVHFNNLTYDRVAGTFYQLDRECISTLVTMEYLAMMCETAGTESVPAPPAGSSQSHVPGSAETSIQQVPFCFDLPRLLRRCQQAEVLLSTLVQDLSELELPSPAGDPDRYDPDAANRELYRLLLDTVAALHQRQVTLTARDCRQIPQLVCERERTERRPHPPFAPDAGGRVARWRCYVKAISPTHVMTTLLPESFDDLKLLMASAGSDGCQYVPEDAEESLRALFDADSRADSLADTVGSGSVSVPPRSASLSTRLAGCGTSSRPAAPPPQPAARSRACSAGAAAKKTVTLVAAETESEEGAPRPPRRRSRHPSSPSKLQHCESDPAQCPHRSRSFPNSDAGQRRRAGGRPSRRRPALLGSLSLPVYVYDCSLRSLTQQLGYRVRPGRPPDLYRDARFSLSEAPPSPGWSGRGTDEPAEDPPHLAEHCNVLQLAHTRSFVVGVFRSLQACRSVHPLDVQWAIDLCDEQPLEVDITDFLKTICGHIRDFTMRSAEQQRHRPADCASVAASDCEPHLPLSLLASHQPCGRLQKVHAEVRAKFARLLRANFGTVPSSPHVLFYLPPGLRTGLDDDSTLPDDYPERVPSADNDTGTVQLNDIDASDVWRDVHRHPEEIFSVVTKTSLLSNVDSESVGDLDDRAVEVGDEREEENMPPLFLQLTCTTRTGTNTYTRHILDLPTCIGELAGEMTEAELPLDSVQVTLDMLCLTLPYQVDARISEHTKHQVRATSFCSDGLGSSEVVELGACGSDDASEHDSFNASQLGAQLGHLSEFQLQAVTVTKAEVQWLLTDEIAALLLDSFPPQLAVLTTVADHVRRSAGQIQSSRSRRGCVHKPIPLYFVFGPDKSMDLFMQEFRHLQVPDYKLAQLDNLYYLVHESSTTQPLTWNLVPPLGSLLPPARFSPPLDSAGLRPRTPDALMAQTMLARSTSVDLCQYAASSGSVSDADECTPENHQRRPAPRRLRRSMSHRPEAALCGEDREVAALFVQPRRRPRSQVCEPAAGGPLETRRCRSAAEVRSEQVGFPSAEEGAAAGDKTCRPDEAVHQEGYEGDGSDSEQDVGTDTERGEHILLPAFWLILRVAEDAVDTFFHCRYSQEDICERKAVHDQVIARINAICRRVNQMLLLQQLERTRYCDSLLEPESSADISARRRAGAEQTDGVYALSAGGYIRPDALSPDVSVPFAGPLFYQLKREASKIGIQLVSKPSVTIGSLLCSKAKHQLPKLQQSNVIYRIECSCQVDGDPMVYIGETDQHNLHHQEANVRYQPGHFSCDVRWQARFALHPRLRGAAHGATPGLAYLRQALETFAVSNRLNMFVFKDPKLGDVFYLRLRECSGSGGHPSGDSASAVSLDERLGTQPARTSITSLTKDEPPRGRCTSVGERDASYRSDSEEGVLLLVHGITEPGPCIKEDLVRLLHSRLDERLLELFTKALLRNPQTKLAPEDVHFIQPPNTPPDHCLKFTLPPSASGHLSSVVGYLRNNLLQMLHQPKYTDTREENQFRDWGSSEESEMFLYVPSEKHGGRGMACVSLSAVRPAGALAAPPSDDDQHQWSPSRFEALTTTRLYDPEVDGASAVLLRFNIWEKGRANLSWLEPRLPSAIRYALWDRCMVWHVLPHSPLEGAGPGPARDLSGALRVGAPPPPALRSFSLFESPASSRAAASGSGGDQTPSIVLTSPALETGRPLEDPPPSAMARFLDRRISSPLTQLQDPPAACSSGQSTPRRPASGEPVPLRPMYGDTLRQWLQFGSELSVPNLKRHTVVLSNRYTVGAFVSGLMRLIQEECPSLSCHICRAVDGGHVLCDSADLDSHDCEGLLLVGHGHREDYVRMAAHRLSFSGQLGTPTPAESTQCSSVPPSPGPSTGSHSFRSPGDLTASPGCLTSSIPLAKQKLAWARVELYTYNWPKEKWDHLHVKCSDLCQWTNARCSLLHSIVAQKLGLFHHQPFTRRPDQAAGEAPNAYLNQMPHILHLIRQSSPPGQQPGHRSHAGARSRLFTETLRDCKPGPLMAPGPTADAVLRHGTQLFEVLKANRKGDEQKKLYHQCQTPESLDKDSTMESFVRLLKGSGRLLHFCFSPLLFLPSWRWQTAVTRDQALSTAREVAARPRPPRARHPSETSCRSGGRPSPRLRRQAADERWHETLCSSLLGEYLQYLQTMRFLPLQYGLKGRRPDAQDPPVCAYLHRVIIGGGGYLLFQIGVEEPFFYVKLYALEALRMRLRGRAPPINSQALQSFLVECDHIRAHTHLHSYMHDYHLRMMQQYVSGRPLMLRQGLHITSFLEDFYNYYPKGPTHARNFMATGTVTIEEQTSTSPDQLYNYLLTHEKRYEMRVLRMIPLFEDSGEETTEDEYVLIQLSQREVHRSESPKQSVMYDLALVVSRDLADPAADTRLRLKFYVLMTSRREIYPTMFIERVFENYRRVDTAPGLQQTETSDSAAPSETSGASSQSDEMATSSSGSGFFSSYGTLRPESVHYLGYFSSHEQFMQSALVDEVKRVRHRIEEVVERAKVHCRRDSLWQRLRDEDDRSRNSSAGGLSCAEMAELLTLVCCRPLDEMDTRLRPLVQQSTSWYTGLIRTLMNKYSDCHRYYQSESGCQRFLVVILPAETSALFVLGVDAEAPCRTVQLHLVTREAAPGDTPQEGVPPPPAAVSSTGYDQQLLHRLTEEFVNCCCYQMWASFIQ